MLRPVFMRFPVLDDNKKITLYILNKKMNRKEQKNEYIFDLNK